MIISRTLAKRRIAEGERPSFIGAWGLVALDAALLVFVVVMLYRPFQWLVTANDFSVGAIVTLLVVVLFLPSQAVLIISALWAAKSRWADDDQKG